MEIIQQVVKFATENWIWCAVGGAAILIVLTVCVVCGVVAKKRRKRWEAALERLTALSSDALTELSQLREDLRKQGERIEELFALVSQPKTVCVTQVETATEEGEGEAEITDGAIGLLDTDADEDDIFAKVEALTKGQPQAFDFKPVIPVYDLSKLEASSDGATADPVDEQASSELDDILGRIDDAIAERKRIK